jgi:hypothetical protein
LVRQAKAFDGNTLISHETLAHARPEHVERAVGAFGFAEVHVVVTARDLARQIPAGWQEQLKNRGETEYSEFVEHVFASWRPEFGGENRFWRAQDVRGVVARWAAAVGTDRVTVVTVPPPGADRLELWRRFAEATDLPDVEYVFAQRDNSSLGVAEAELLRRLNPRLRDELDWPRYDGLIKKRLSEGVLGPLDAQGRLRLPERWTSAVAEIAAAEIEYLASSGVTIVGSLDDLAPVRAVDSEEPARQPEDLTDAELLDAALAAIAALAVRPPPGPPPGTAPRREGIRGRSMALARRLRDRLPHPLRERLRRH